MLHSKLTCLSVSVYAPGNVWQTGDLASALVLPDPSDSAVAADMRLIVQELQSARQKQREFAQLVSDLQSEQKLANERVALYSVLALQLKRELINERLAHIDSKHEVAELRAAKSKPPPQQQRDSGDEKPSSQELALEDEDDPWSSPVKTPGIGGSGGVGGRGSGSGLLSFSSFYHSARPLEGEDEPPSPLSSTGGGLHPLRGSLMDQFLPASLLDSPQTTPSSKSFGHKEDESDARSADRLAFDAEIARSLDAFSLGEPPCQQCKQTPVAKCAPCGHEVCASCESDMRAKAVLACPRCQAEVASITELKAEEGNQVEHLLEEDRRVALPAAPTPAAAVVSPVTLSVMSELFDSIPVEELERALKEASGQASLAIEKILHTHPSFNPGGSSSGAAATGATTAAPNVGSRLVSSPPGPGLKTSLHRSSSNNPSERAGGSGTGSAVAAGNWKTELCMYYLQGKCNKTRRTCSFAHGESDLARPGAPKHSSSSAGGYKTRLCPLYMEGMCPKSRRDCPLAHGESDLRDALSTPAVLPAAAAPRLQSYKTELCYYYLKGCCNYTKEDCRFAHGESDLRTIESNTMELNAKFASGEFVPGVSGPGSMSSVTSGAMGLGGGDSNKHLQHQHQYQQQFQAAQFQSPPQQQPPSQQLQHSASAFTPAHLQHAMPPHHQFPFQAPPPHLPPPHLAMHHQQQQLGPQQSLYHGNQQTHQFRYGMDSSKRSTRPPPPQPRRDWSGGYDPSVGGGTEY